jgi:endonuclease/exonuclease/phosphatase family metal-dependent hydrolase
MRITAISFCFALLSCAFLLACESTDTTPRIVPDAATGGSGGTPDPMPLKIVTWNVHNLVDDVNDGAPQEWVENTAEWEAHRAAVGQVLADIDADIIAFQEIEHAGVMAELDEQDLGSAYPHQVLFEGNDPRGVDVGLMSKIPLGPTDTHADEEFARVGTSAPVYQYSRDCLEVHLAFNGRPVALLVVHYKAKENDDPDKRLAEAQHTRAIADEIEAASPDTAILILGDFNDLPGSLPYQWTVGDVDGQGDVSQYTDAAVHVPPTDRWTFDYQGALELVDHQMANPVLTGMIEPNSVEILHGPEVDEQPGGASDHSPLVATYQIY